MSAKTGIEWCDATYNPWHGCHKISPGCQHCYMYSDKARYGQDPNKVVRSKTTFSDPLKWKEPKRIFTCSWSDFFIEEADAWRAEAWEIMKQTPQHTYLILTKRPERIAGRLPWMPVIDTPSNPWKHIWIGVTAENQEYADLRIPYLINLKREIPWITTFVSYEPALGPISFPEVCRKMSGRCWCNAHISTVDSQPFSLRPWPLNWAIIGTESGPHRRDMQIEWAESLVSQCHAAGVSVFTKQLPINGKVSKNPEEWPAALRVREFPEVTPV